jgi:hypothetical protein
VVGGSHGSEYEGYGPLRSDIMLFLDAVQNSEKVTFKLCHCLSVCLSVSPCMCLNGVTRLPLDGFS